VPRRYPIQIAPTGYRSLRDLKDKKTRRQIAKGIDGLGLASERQGKALVGPIEGVPSVRAVRDRFRVLYDVDKSARLVSVLLVGERSPGPDADIYALAKKLLSTFGKSGSE
jgi:mRNA interferase RelE/StbE